MPRDLGSTLGMALEDPNLRRAKVLGPLLKCTLLVLTLPIWLAGGSYL